MKIGTEKKLSVNDTRINTLFDYLDAPNIQELIQVDYLQPEPLNYYEEFNAYYS